MSIEQNVPVEVWQEFKKDLMILESLVQYKPETHFAEEQAFCHWFLSGEADRFIDNKTGNWKEA